VFVDRQRDYLRAVVGKGIARVAKARFFNPNHAAGAGKQARQQVKTLLAAQGQQHLIVGGSNSAARQHTANQLVDQLAGTDVFAFLPPAIHGFQFQRQPAALAPLREGELPRVELPVNKRIAHFAPGRRAVHEYHLRVGPVHAGGPVGRLCCLLGGWAGVPGRGNGAANKKTVTGP